MRDSALRTIADGLSQSLRVFLLQLRMYAPKTLGGFAFQNIAQNIEMRVPAARDAQALIGIGEQAMGDGEFYLAFLVTMKLLHQFKADFGFGAGTLVPDITEQTQRLPGSHFADHGHIARALGVFGRGDVVFRAEFGIAEGVIYFSPQALLDIASGEPFGALVGFGQVLPDPLNRAGQQSL